MTSEQLKENIADIVVLLEMLDHHLNIKALTLDEVLTWLKSAEEQPLTRELLIKISGKTKPSGR